MKKLALYFAMLFSLGESINRPIEAATLREDHCRSRCASLKTLARPMFRPFISIDKSAEVTKPKENNNLNFLIDLVNRSSLSFIPKTQARIGSWYEISIRRFCIGIHSGIVGRRFKALSNLWPWFYHKVAKRLMGETNHTAFYAVKSFKYSYDILPRSIACSVLDKLAFFFTFNEEAYYNQQSGSEGTFGFIFGSAEEKIFKIAKLQMKLRLNLLIRAPIFSQLNNYRKYTLQDLCHLSIEPCIGFEFNE